MNAAAVAVNIGQVFAKSFLGHAPKWYKLTIAGSLLLNFCIYAFFGPLVTSWVILAQFVFTLAMALKCFPLQPGGLLVLQAVLLLSLLHI